MKKSNNNIESDPFLMSNFNYNKQKVAKDKPNAINF